MSFASPAPDANIESLRLPPHSLEAEQAVLGGLLLRNGAWDTIGDLIQETDFYREDHRIIWRAIVRQVENNKPADVLTITEVLKKRAEVQDAGGLHYLHQIAQGTPSTANIRHYAQIVRDNAVLRQLATAAAAIGDAAYSSRGRDVREIIDSAEKQILAVSESGVRKGDEFQSIGQALAVAMTNLDELHRNPASVTGKATGFVDLDEMTTGFQDGDLIIVAGRPSMGKTALALNIAEHVALELRLPVAVFSMEMSNTQLATRLLGSVAKVDGQKLRTGKLDMADWDRLGVGLGKVNEAPIHIDASPALTALDIRARARRKKRELGALGLVVVDYLQLMQTIVQGGDNRASAIGDITRGLKTMAKELGCPVVALSQLSRGVESRPNKRPVMADLRESGSIEQDADLILFIYRDEVYHEESADKGIAEIIVGKQRNGPIGTVRLTFMGKHTRFENYSGAPGHDNGHSHAPRTPRTPPKKAFTDTDK